MTTAAVYEPKDSTITSLCARVFTLARQSNDATQQERNDEIRVLNIQLLLHVRPELPSYIARDRAITGVQNLLAQIKTRCHYDTACSAIATAAKTAKTTPNSDRTAQ